MSYYFIFVGNSIALLHGEGRGNTIPLLPGNPATLPSDVHIMEVTPMDDGTEVHALALNNEETLRTAFPELQLQLCDLRKSYYKLTLAFYLKAGKCKELLYWDTNSRYCGHCGAPMKMHTPISKVCTQCGREIWPLLSTAIIVLIHRGDEVLLVHARNFRSDFYGLVAGFVETGETLEEAVHREVREETGMEITNLRYFGSQPWPYPCGLMVGYNADYVSGDLHLQRDELSRGAWFTKSNLPTIPEKLSIARMILDDWISKS